MSLEISTKVILYDTISIYLISDILRDPASNEKDVMSTDTTSFLILNNRISRTLQYNCINYSHCCSNIETFYIDNVKYRKICLFV